MSTVLRVVPPLLLAAACGLGACGVLGGHDPRDPVTVRVHESPLLGEYDGEPHKALVHLYFVSDPTRFREAATRELLVREGSVPGGRFVATMASAPGSGFTRSMGPPGSDAVRHVGVVVPFFGEKLVRRAVAEIPFDGRLLVELRQGSRGHLSIRPDD